MTLRAVNLGGNATAGIVVNGVALGNAAAGYTSLAAAITASSAGDTIVFTEDAAEYTVAAITTALANLRITADDTVRWSGGKYGSGARMALSGAQRFSATSGTTVFENLGRRQPGAGNLAGSGSGGTLRISRCVFQHDGAGSACIAGTGAVVIVDNTRIEVSVQGGNTAGVVSASGDKNMRLFNVSFVFTSSAGTACKLVQGLNASNRVTCVNVWALKTSGASTPTYYWNAVAHDSYAAGNNGCTGTGSPGTTVYDNTAAEDILAGTSPLDMRWASRAVAESYPGADVSAECYVADYDADNDARGDEWFVGADWLADTTGAPAQSGGGFFSSFGSFGRMGL